MKISLDAMQKVRADWGRLLVAWLISQRAVTDMEREGAALKEDLQTLQRAADSAAREHAKALQAMQSQAWIHAPCSMSRYLVHDIR